MSEHSFPSARMSNIYLIPLPPSFFKHSQKLDNERSKSELNLRTCSYHRGGGKRVIAVDLRSKRFSIIFQTKNHFLFRTFIYCCCFEKYLVVGFCYGKPAVYSGGVSKRKICCFSCWHW